MSRKFPRAIKRIVIKIGSRTVAQNDFKPNARRLGSLARQISQACRYGQEVFLVSSGAIVLGMGKLGVRSTTADLASLQSPGLRRR